MTMKPAVPEISPELRPVLAKAAAEVTAHLQDGIIPFWRERAADRVHGGYEVRFDEAGRSLGTTEKYLNTQCRLLWWFSTLARAFPAERRFAELAWHGYTFIRDRFWDDDRGGWFWKVRADGGRLDDGKVVYGQSFAIYALAEFSLMSGDEEACSLASGTFDLLQIHCADTHHGGYHENLEPDWTLSEPGFAAGDRKSLDTHMHLMEAFTVLYEATGNPLHRRKLLEVAELIQDRMLDRGTGCGLNQFDAAFRPLPAIAIRRTWNAERTGDAPAVPTDTTSYGHNTELAWLLRRALETARADLTAAEPRLRALVDHAVVAGVDWQHGGLYRDGTATGGPLVREKEFWQNAEALVGFLDAFERFGDARYLEAFLNLWNFARDHFIAPCGEWRVLLDRLGRPLNTDTGNDWKVSYHTGRAMLESSRRLRRILAG
jgi:mannose/cellobiose epimerase-like protein (N-acyl-D-glucosamine 2-epimerase family)